MRPPPKTNGELRCVAIETSTPALSVAIGTEAGALAEQTFYMNFRHAERLLEAITALLKEAEWKMGEISVLAVSVGPGSFTGIRVGIAAIRGLAQVLEKPVVALSSLEIMACGASHEGREVYPFLDALRGQVFAAGYRIVSKHMGVAPQLLWKPQLMTLQGWEKRIVRRARALGKPTVVVGEQAPMGSPLQSLDGRVLQASPCAQRPRASVLVERAVYEHQKGRSLPYSRVVPLYLRPSFAEERVK